MIHIIANPAAQSGAGRKRIHNLMDLLMKNRLDSSLHLTHHPGHAGELASSLPLTDEDTLIIIGGDGSIDETINGLPLPSSVPMALFPAGSGNDFARGMKISHNPEELIQLLINPSKNHVIAADLGEVTVLNSESESNPHRFAVSCGMGMDAAICLELERGRLKRICNRFHIGKLSYLIIGIKNLFQTGKRKRASIQLTLDQTKTYTYKNVVFVSVHNLPYEGGGFPFCPDAIPTDGKLDLCIIHVPCRLLMIPILIANLCGAHHGIFRHWVTLLRASEIQVTSDRPMAFHTDGEAISDQNGFHIRVLPEAITFLR